VIVQIRLECRKRWVFWGNNRIDHKTADFCITLGNRRRYTGKGDRTATKKWMTLSKVDRATGAGKVRPEKSRIGALEEDGSASKKRMAVIEKAFLKQNIFAMIDSERASGILLRFWEISMAVSMYR
jgi:hypothetical protein